MGKYDDLLDLPHPVSATHPPMPLIDRAAQFSPFAALSGYEDELEEAARLTEAERTPGEAVLADLDARLRLLAAHISEQPEITATYFVPDEKKDGGRYVTAAGRVKKVRAAEREIELTDGRRIAFERLLALEGAVFDALE